MRLVIRWLIRRDMAEVLQVENSCFEFPWCEDDFLGYLWQRNCIGMVVEHENAIVGFFLYELKVDHPIVHTIAVSPSWQGQGVGRAIVEKLIEKISKQRRTHMKARVRETNLDAQLFLRATGWRAVGVDRSPYDESDEDGYRFEYWLEWPKPLDDMEDKFVEDAADSAYRGNQA